MDLLFTLNFFLFLFFFLNLPEQDEVYVYTYNAEMTTIGLEVGNSAKCILLKQDFFTGASPIVIIYISRTVP